MLVSNSADARPILTGGGLRAFWLLESSLAQG